MYGVRDVSIHSRTSSKIHSLEHFTQNRGISQPKRPQTPHCPHPKSWIGWLCLILWIWPINFRLQLLALLLWNISGPGISCSCRPMRQVGKLGLSIAPRVWFQGLQATDRCWCFCVLTLQLRHVTFLGQGFIEPRTLSSVLIFTSLDSLRMLTQ